MTALSAIRLSDDLLQRRAGAWLRVDWLAIGLEATLLVIGIAFIYGAGIEVGGSLAGKWLHQLEWLALGIVVYVVTAAIDYHLWCRHSWLFYLAGILLLLAVLLFGRTLNNTRGWLRVPGIGLVQPGEAAKPLTMLFLAWLASLQEIRHTALGIWLPAILLALASFLPGVLICLQPDFGTAMVLLPVTIVMMLLTGLRWRWFALGAAAVLLLLPIFYMKLKPYQKDRVKVFAADPARNFSRAVAPFLPDRAARGFEESVERFFTPAKGERKQDDWNARQSLLAVGSGGMFGKGYLHGTQHVLGYLPRTIAPTDFIFSVIAEETGFLGAGTIIGLLAGLMLCFCRTALSAADSQGTCLAMGAVIIFSTHILINISMTIQAAPIVGIPLPFISYGGSFMISTLFLAGLVQSVQIHRSPFFQDPSDSPDALYEAT